MTALDFHYYPNPHAGYGRMGIQMAAALKAAGVELTSRATTRVIASNLSGVDGWYSHQRRVLWTMWEADSYPEAYNNVLDNVDMVLVPSEANRATFSVHHPNVEVLHLGIEPCVPKLREAPRVFLAGGRGWERKGLDAAIEAFVDVCEGRDAVLWLRREGRERPHPLLSHPQVKLVGRVRDPYELMLKADVFISASRGEGFGLMPLEAMATGMPTILSDAHGHAEFSRWGTPIPCTKVKAEFSGLGDPGMWWEPDPEALRAAIADHLERFDVHAARQYACALDVQREFAWDPHRLLELAGPTITQTRGAWQPYQSPRVHKIRVTETVDAHIGPHHVRMAPNTLYLHTWDVKRVLHEAGYLDPELWDPNSVKEKVL